jgi:2-deoxystreptamine N-acetyl-D-glucosaminyltransferase/2-deoxystreptamine glucosyltransferase
MQNHTAQLTRALDGLGVAQTVITARPPGAPERQQLSSRVTVRRFGLPVPFARQLYGGPALAAALQAARDADVVHAHLGEDLAVLPIAFAAARSRGLPVVVTVHTSLAHTFTPDGLSSRVLKTVGGRIEHAGCARAARVITLTPRLARLIGDAGLVQRDRLHVIPSGVVPAEFAGGPAGPVPHVGRPRIVFAGRLARQKGVQVLAEAVRHLRTPDVEVLVVGDGPERAAFECSLREGGVLDRVHLAGFRPHHEIPAILRSGDVFVMPSMYEELGSVLLEAMQARLPIVASATGGIPDAVGDAAVLVAPGDPVALAREVDGLLADPDRCARLSAAAGERARRYDWSALAAEVLDVYRLALGRGALAAA